MIKLAETRIIINRNADSVCYFALMSIGKSY